MLYFGIAVGELCVGMSTIFLNTNDQRISLDYFFWCDTCGLAGCPRYSRADREEKIDPTPSREFYFFVNVSSLMKYNGYIVCFSL